MKKYIYMVLISLLTLSSGAAQAQIKVSGKVTNQDGSPILGATVVLENTAIGTSTTMDGTYSITVPNENIEGTLIFTYIGYDVKSVDIASRSVIDVQLGESAADIDKVVVVGYGTMRKSDVTGSLASITVDETEAGSNTSIDRLIQGRVAGVQVTSGSAAPGGTMSIKIRGGSSFNSNSEPLYVIDGIIMSTDGATMTDSFASSGSGQDEQSPLNSLNVQDIESMEILKDASATAIYGSQGANGVVLITTKQGTTTKAKVAYSGSFSVSSASKHIDMLNRDEYIELRMAKDPDAVLTDLTDESIDWQDRILKTAFSHNHYINVSGRTKSTSYMISAGYTNSAGLIETTSVQKGNIKINLDQRIKPWLKIGTRSSFAYTTQNMTQSSDGNGRIETSIIRQMMLAKPYLSSTTDDDNADEETIEGPMAWLSGGMVDQTNEYRIMPQLYADIKLARWLTFKTSINLDYTSKERAKFYDTSIFTGRQYDGMAGISTLKSLKYNFDNMLNANFDLGRHRISATAGVTANQTINESMAQKAQYLSNLDYDIESIILGTNVKFTPVFADTNTSLFSALARLIYSYDDRYVLTATVRSDGSSKFSRKNRYSTFPSFAFAWRASEESFIKDIDAINNLKLRVGWGRVGNQGLRPYQTLATYGSSNLSDPTSESILIGYTPSRIPNENLKWETTEQVNIGLDFGLFRNRLSGSVDVYDKRTFDLLQSVDLAPSSGFGTMWVNQGEINNRGIELMLNGTLINTKSVQWNISGNISFNRNIITDAGVEPSQFGIYNQAGFLGRSVTNSTNLGVPVTIFLEGQPMGLFYGLETDGIIQENESGPLFNGSEYSTPGAIKYVDQNNDNNITSADYKVIGDPNPDFTYGFSTSVSYKRWTLDANFAGSYGNDLINGNLLQEENVNLTNSNNIRSEAYHKAWTPQNTDTNYPALGHYLPSTNMAVDRIVEDGSYLRLANLTLSYSVNPKHLSQWISRCNISFTARNLLCITNYSGFDPEVNSFAWDPLRQGLDWASYPNNKAFIMGVNITF